MYILAGVTIIVKYNRAVAPSCITLPKTDGRLNNPRLLLKPPSNNQNPPSNSAYPIEKYIVSQEISEIKSVQPVHST